jgi:type I restriction enzyme M protein
MPSLLQPEIDQAEINSLAWKACEPFRGAVDPSIIRNYVLGFLFFKSISDVWKDRLVQFNIEYKGDREQVQRRMSRERFIVPEGQDFDTIYKSRNEANIGELIDRALSAIEEANKIKLESVFRHIRFTSETDLGEAEDHNRRLKNLIEAFADPRLDMRPSRIGESDVIGETSQSLIEHFASDAGKKGGEFYTPPEVSALLAKLLHPKKGARICDPACGSGSLLIRLADEVEGGDVSLYGQESNHSTWVLGRINLLLHGKDHAHIEWGNTLSDPKLLEQDALTKFDVVASNPLFSLDPWDAEAAANDRFQRFHRGAPPKSKADYALITHMIESTAAGSGKAGLIVPHGVLFRGGAEGAIRRRLIEENLLDCVVGLPANLFYGGGIPAAILIFNRGKKTTDVLFIDANREYEEAKNQSKLRPSDIEKIVVTYRTFASVEKYARRATFDEVKENNFHLNISRYVDLSEKEGEIDLKAVQEELEALETELAEVRAEMKGHLKELGLDRRR